MPAHVARAARGVKGGIAGGIKGSIDGGVEGGGGQRALAFRARAA